MGSVKVKVRLAMNRLHGAGMRLVLLGVILWRCRPSGLLPTSVAERLMWSVWVGYVASCFVLAVAYRLATGLEIQTELLLYPLLAALTGMAFFVLGSSYWGGCYLIALAFYALALLMNVDARWSPTEFGVLWAVALVVIGLRLRRLAQASRQDESRGDA